jgi:hypothetical protein
LGVWFSRRLAGLVVVATVLLVVPPAATPAEPGGATMFVHTANGGELSGGRLILRGVGRQVAWVTTGGGSGVVSVARLHRRLFPRRTPAATGLLHIAGQRPRRAVALRLRRPRYSAPRHRVSYATRPLKRGQGSIPRRFGAASLSILGDPAVSGDHDCSVSLANHTLNDLAVVSATKSGTDIWDPEIRPGTVAGALTGIVTWQSDGGQLLGCSNTVVWQFAANASQPGTFTMTTSYPWTSPFSNTCASSNPQFICRAVINEPGRVLWEIKPK